MEQHSTNQTIPTKKKRVSKKKAAKIESSLSLSDIKDLLLFVSTSTTITEFSIGNMSMKFDRDAIKRNPTHSQDLQERAAIYNQPQPNHFQPVVHDSSLGIWSDTFGRKV